ncbi:two-component system sensor histidine kinase YesM [Cohnella sp. SGD-V74]|uniref:sensor histidine kinase n=1 Tax=unclassified Cohnella TaxID=2636738 RepID=UPI000D4F93BF|nr:MULTISPECIES: sensor histidine kinase [unclassified Cohnella]PRX68674.1 two-component system sensor histidine kinase YesM [Cohnella sp. SGD-V74]
MSELSQATKSKYVPIRYKLLASYLILVLIPVIVIGAYAYLTSSKEIEQNTRDNLDVAVHQIANNMQFRVDDVSRSAEAVYSDQTLSRYLSGYFLDWERHQITTQYILPRLEAASQLPKSKVRLTVYLNNPTIGEVYYLETEQVLEAGERQYEIKHASRVEGEPWFRESLQLSPVDFQWRQVELDKKYGYISLLRPLINYDTFELIGLIRVSVKLKDLFEGTAFGELGDNSRLFVLDGGGGRLYPDEAAEGEEERGEINETDYIRIEKSLGDIPATVVALVPVDSIREQLQKVQTLTVFVCLLSIVVLTLASLFISKMFSKRFMKLIHSLQAFKEGDYGRRIGYKGRDEFADIAESFNDMAATTQQLIDEVYVSKLEKKEAELQILHAQINPHFLNNTFSSISRMAKLGEIAKLHEIIRELAKFYRLTLNRGEMLISIEKEVQIIESYLNIQNIKYASRILTSIDIQPGTERYETVKFVLQPFVENVLEHAWYDDEISIDIRIERQSDTIVMTVSDNGLGMKQETINAILGAGTEKIGYGIRNVDERIKLHYGKDYGVDIQSVVGQGTQVRIVLPVIPLISADS